MSDSADQDESSLDRLSQAFAKAMGLSKKKPAPEPAAPPTTLEDSKPEETDPDDACPISPKSILEAILFVGHPENEPIAGATVAKLLRGVDEAEVVELVEELNGDYAKSQMPYEIVAITEKVTSGLDSPATDDSATDGEPTDKPADKSAEEEGMLVSGYRLQLREEFGHLRENFYGRVREAQLSQLAIDVLAVVAYNQPVTQVEIDRMLDSGLSTSSVLNQLVRRDLLSKAKDAESKRKEYSTTDRFLSLFNLADINDLPRSDEPE